MANDTIEQHVTTTAVDKKTTVMVQIHDSLTTHSLMTSLKDEVHTANDDVTTEVNPTTIADIAAGDSSAIGVAVGVAVAVVILIILFTAVIVLFLRRRRIRRRDKSIVKIENPHYKLTDTEDRQATLSTAPTVKFTANNNTASVSSSTNNKSRSKKQKEAAPLPPIYHPPTENNRTNWDSLAKRKAPPPPALNISSEIYGKDSPSVSVENVMSAINVNSSSPVDVNAASPVDDSRDMQTNKSYTQPLIVTDNNKHLSSSPRHNTQLGSSSSPSHRPQTSITDKNKEQDVAGMDDDDIATADVTASLIDKNKKAASNLSLDSYDRTKNPFFAD